MYTCSFLLSAIITVIQYIHIYKCRYAYAHMYTYCDTYSGLKNMYLQFEPISHSLYHHNEPMGYQHCDTVRENCVQYTINKMFTYIHHFCFTVKSFAVFTNRFVTTKVFYEYSLSSVPKIRSETGNHHE